MPLMTGTDDTATTLADGSYTYPPVPLMPPVMLVRRRNNRRSSSTPSHRRISDLDTSGATQQPTLTGDVSDAGADASGVAIQVAVVGRSYDLRRPPILTIVRQHLTLDLSSEAPLSDGLQSVLLSVGDVAGNSDTSTHALVIDSTLPAPPLITGINDDTGALNNDAVTRDRTPDLHHTAEPSSRVQLVRKVQPFCQKLALPI